MELVKAFYDFLSESENRNAINAAIFFSACAREIREHPQHLIRHDDPTHSLIWGSSHMNYMLDSLNKVGQEKTGIAFFPDRELIEYSSIPYAGHHRYIGEWRSNVSWAVRILTTPAMRWHSQLLKDNIFPYVDWYLLLSNEKKTGYPELTMAYMELRNALTEQLDALIENWGIDVVISAASMRLLLGVVGFPAYTKLIEAVFKYPNSRLSVSLHEILGFFITKVRRFENLWREGRAILDRLWQRNGIRSIKPEERIFICKNGHVWMFSDPIRLREVMETTKPGSGIFVCPACKGFADPKFADRIYYAWWYIESMFLLSLAIIREMCLFGDQDVRPRIYNATVNDKGYLEVQVTKLSKHDTQQGWKEFTVDINKQEEQLINHLYLLRELEQSGCLQVMP
jgi:hypothetical protein